MPRKKILDRRSVAPDPRFNSVLVAKFTNGLMVEGKKTVARRLFYDAMEIIQGKVSDQDPLTVFEEAMEKITGLEKTFETKLDSKFNELLARFPPPPPAAPIAPLQQQQQRLLPN